METKTNQQAINRVNQGINDAIKKRIPVPKGKAEEKQRKAFHNAAKQAPVLKNTQKYKDKHDELAHSLIGLSSCYSEDFFQELPDIDAITVLRIIERMREADYYNTNVHLKSAKLKPSMDKRIKKQDEWQPYKKMFSEKINVGKTKAWSLNYICDQIEKRNKATGDTDKYICVKVGKDGTVKPRPHKTTVRRQLLPKEK